jgi:hypothetical protein
VLLVLLLCSRRSPLLLPLLLLLLPLLPALPALLLLQHLQVIQTHQQHQQPAALSWHVTPLILVPAVVTPTVRTYTNRTPATAAAAELCPAKVWQPQPPLLQLRQQLLQSGSSNCCCICMVLRQQLHEPSQAGTLLFLGEQRPQAYQAAQVISGL